MGGKSEILMVIAAIIMSLAFGLVVGPSINQSTNTPKYAVINSEIGNIKNASALWIGANTTDGTYSGITATGVQTYLPGLTLNASNELVSKVNTGITYVVGPKTGDATQLEITVKGLTAVSGAETSVKNTQTSLASTVTDTTANDGTLVFAYKG